MPATITCDNHPTKVAVHKCKQCGKNLCSDCFITTDIGIFCGNACYRQMKQFQEQVNALGVQRGPGFLDTVLAWAKQLVGAAILLGIIYGVFYYAFDAQSPRDIWNVVKGWIGL